MKTTALPYQIKGLNFLAPHDRNTTKFPIGFFIKPSLSASISEVIVSLETSIPSNETTTVSNDRTVVSLETSIPSNENNALSIDRVAVFNAANIPP